VSHRRRPIQMEYVVGAHDEDVRCGECGATMVLKESRFGLFWGCRNFQYGCRGTIGAHPDGTPLGRPADKATKAARIVAHDAFDRLWKRGKTREPVMKRGAAYRWMQGAMGMTPDEAHIGLFNVETCERLVDKVNAYLEGDS
jgi:hypothetical protein